MPSTLEKLSTNRVKLTIEMPFDELKPSLDKAYKDIANQVNVPGFRKGKVPAPVIDQRFGRGVVLQEAINDALPAAYGKAIEENTVVPLGQPEIEVTKLEDGEVVEFTAEVDVRPDFDLPDVSAISVEVPAVEVPDEDVNERVETLRQRFATNTEVERAAAKGDLVTIDLAGSRDGEALDDATASGVTYKVGSEGMLEGLDEAVTGLKAGESAEFHSTLVGGPLRGQDADIKVTVTKVCEQELPAVDDDFAQLVSQFDTVEEMRADLRTALENMARLDQAADARDKVLEEVISKIDIELPTRLIDSELEARRQQVNQQLAQAGMTVEEYLEESEEEVDNADDFWAEIEKRSLDALKAQIVLDKMADDDEIGVEQDELTELLFRKAQQNGTSPEEEAQHMMQHNHLPDWMQEIRRGKALASMVGAATVTDSKGNTLELDRIQPDGTIADEPAEDAAAEDSDKAGKGSADTTEDEADEETKAEDEASKKTTTKKAAAKKPAAKKTATKKAGEAKADDKPAAKKAPAKKPAAKKTATKGDKAE
ncbi:trigger factor [Cutibacterium sp. WCA-380-WT-3A]|uniref:Trigger factor n=1 Tax=Cutibacterium porci TaxID=2605781 RepID=A0A7K0J9B8_9ACTN|nr:trigger factor [Cutibacterium porci]MSS46572.1 trigger factor [Cutibacterium porci]